MNERMRELAEQARHNSRNEKHYLERIHNREISLDEYQAIYDNKFAELIVKECAMIVEGFEFTYEAGLDEYVDYEASAVLKEHFGVE